MQGLVHSAKTASRIMAMQNAFQERSNRFSRAHSSTSPNYLPTDGRFATLERDVLSSTGALSWPRRSAALLHGLCSPATPLFPDESAFQLGSRALRDADPESYFAKLYAGPPEARHFSDMAALLVYFDLLNELRIMWIGPDIRWADAVQDLKIETNNFVNWSRVHQPYANALNEAL
ncbi:hypothetical protein [Glycocaulis alkaliphilus]|uniref:hypothetical protein n=1 Tax=Glycocaulis alkaliphilus TaxID=1434191 RepID=UPI000FD94281|nr:hypothetical protein [Glycocaulis alkaliphilus]